MNRRSFLRGAAAVVGALSLPWTTKKKPGETTPPVCPECGTRKVRYVAGLPGDWDGLRRSQAAGEFVWKGSCVVHPDDPEWARVPCHRAELKKRMAYLGFEWKPGFADPGVRFVRVDRANESPGPRSQGDSARGSEAR
jgi:hypothetical protein